MLTYAASGEMADVRPHALEVAAGGAIALIARTPRGLLPLDVKLRGLFNVENVLCVVAIGELLELPHEAVRAGIASLAGVPGRFEPVDAGQPFTVLVDYAHTPDSLETCCGPRARSRRGSVICVFGCGGDRDRGKRPLMGAVARRLADRAIVTTDNPRSEDPAAIAAEITAGFEMEVELDRRRAIELAVAAARSRRRGRDRRQGARAGPAVRRPDAAVRRPHRRARGAGGHAGGDMIAIDTLRDRRADRRQRRRRGGGRGRHDRLPAGRAGATCSWRCAAAAPTASPTSTRRWPRARWPRWCRAAPPGRGRIEVDDVLAALAVIAREVRLRSRARVVGITGSTGKTSTKDILAVLLEPHVDVVASRQNENNELGVPLTLAPASSATPRWRWSRWRCGGWARSPTWPPSPRPTSASSPASARCTWSCSARVGRVAAAKAELLDALPADGVAIVPHGEPLLAPHLAELRCPVVTLRNRSRRPTCRLVSFRRQDAGGEAEIARPRSNPVPARELHVAAQRRQPDRRRRRLRRARPAPGRCRRGRCGRCASRAGAARRSRCRAVAC